MSSGSGIVPAARWYVLLTERGREGVVRDQIVRRVRLGRLENRVGEVIWPVREAPGRPAIRPACGPHPAVARVSPALGGFVLVRMRLDDATWEIVRRTPGIRGFVGAAGRPEPMDETRLPGLLEGMGRADLAAAVRQAQATAKIAADEPRHAEDEPPAPPRRGPGPPAATGPWFRRI